MKKSGFFILYALLPLVLWAIPARKGIYKTIIQADGSEVRVELQGDEYASWWQAESGLKYGLNRQIPASPEVSRRQRKPLGKPRKTRNVGQSMRGLLVLTEFSDVKFDASHTRSLYDNILNTNGYTNEELGFVGSVRDYYLTQSRGQFDYTFDVIGPVTLPQNQQYYGQNSNGSYNSNMSKFVIDALNGMKDQVNFADYDNDGDGYVDEVFFLYAGMAESDGGGEDCIWPHMYYLESYGETFCKDGVRIDTYACANEIQKGGGINGIGPIVHEFSHCLGLPDMYDTSGGNCYGEDYWSVMHAGCYLGGTFRPCGFTALERELCGWMDIETLRGDTVVENAVPISEGGVAYKMVNRENPHEYFVLEPRSKTGWDADLPGWGLLIHHVDYNTHAWDYNKVNVKPDHQRCSVVPSDNSTRSATRSGDTYPSNLNDELTDLTTPSTALFNYNADFTKQLGQSVYRIRRNEDRTVSFHYTPSLYEYAPKTLEGAYFYESFDHCIGKGGNDRVFSGMDVGRGAFRPDMEWICTSAMNGAVECAMFGQSTGTTYATTPLIETEEQTVLKFRACPFAEESEKIVLLVKNADGTTVTTMQMAMEAGKWNDFEVPVTYTGPMTITFATTKRFFMDEVILLPQRTGIINSVVEQSIDGRKYDISGKLVNCGIGGIVIENGRKTVKNR